MYCLWQSFPAALSTGVSQTRIELRVAIKNPRAVVLLFIAAIVAPFP
jgi:hypothetical protein